MLHHIKNHGAYGTLKVVFVHFPGPFMSIFQDCLINWLSNKSDFHVHVQSAARDLGGVLKQSSVLVYMGQKMREPFGRFSITFQHLGLIPGLENLILNPTTFLICMHADKMEKLHITFIYCHFKVSC